MMFVIPYFIPHQGCPHQCSFCNQRSITGEEQKELQVEMDIDLTIRKWLEYRKTQEPVQFAFYGGSFTCLPRIKQEKMLEAVGPWLNNGSISGIRLSTRPDCVTREICSVLKQRGVTTVELGVQSLDDNVLLKSKRGHQHTHCAEAVKYLKEAEFRIGIQLMPGLPGESRLSFKSTIKNTVHLQPSFVRIYPALVIEGSELADLYHSGEYKPLSLGMSVVLAGWAREVFLEAGISVVRMGLQPSPSLEKSLIAGPYDPAFGEMVISRWWLKRVRTLLGKYSDKKVTVTISHRDLSAFNGKCGINRTRLQFLGLDDRLEVVVDREMKRGTLQYVVN